MNTILNSQFAKIAKKEEPTMEESSEATIETTNTTTSTNSSSNNTTTTNNGSSTKTESTPAPHEHTWVEKTTTVHHDAVTHEEQHITGYNTIHHDAVKAFTCNCGIEWLKTDLDSYIAHANATYCAGSGTVYEKQAAYDEQGDPIYETVTVTDTPAYDEIISDGYYCSGCGQTK